LIGSAQVFWGRNRLLAETFRRDGAPGPQSRAVATMTRDRAFSLDGEFPGDLRTAGSHSGNHGPSASFQSPGWIGTMRILESSTMGTLYFKRLRLELELGGSQFPAPVLPTGFEWQSWTPDLLMRHAVTKHESFRAELDARIFPCFRDTAGCLDLMSEIAQRATFLPITTWLITCRFPDGTTDDCATIQGIIQSGGWGAIQNVGVVPEYRGRGLGRALLLKCIAGFQQAGVPRIYLEVTASNLPAVQLYRSLGFCLGRTTYRAVEESAEIPAGESMEPQALASRSSAESL